MAKAKNKNKGKIMYIWIETPQGFCPRIQVGDILLELEPRPARTFITGEREAFLFQLSNMIGEKLFGCERFVPNDQGNIIKNPQWGELDVLEPEPENNVVGLDGEKVDVSDN